jgi:ligand-binding sensor domain-containing protein
VWLAAVLVLAAAVAIFGGSALWRARDVLREAREDVSSRASFRFSVRPLVPVIPAGLESMGAPAVFNDAAVFQGNLYIAGPAGLAKYDGTSSDGTAGSILARYRVGAELPPAPVTSLAIGLAGDSQAPELWIGTWGEGLVAFDGRSFRQIRAEDARLRKITAILPAATGRILIGTEKAGVLVYDGHVLAPFHSSVADVAVTALAGNDADLWIGTLDRGLLHWKAGAVEALDDVLPDKQILSLALTGETLYAGTGVGIAEIRGGKFGRVLAPGYFAQTLLAANDKLWMGTLEEGMFAVPLDAHPGRLAQLGAASVCPGCSIRKILQIDGEVYALAEDSLWHGNEALIRREDALLADRNIAALKMDSTGRLWIGYFDRGLQILNANGERGEHLEDDHLFCVNRIAHDPVRGVSAVATANGLVMFDAATTRRRVIGQAEGLIANQVTDVVLRPDGSMIAATPAGISFIDAGGISSIYAFQGLVNNHVYALASDGARTLAGTLGGLSILDGAAVRASFTTSNSALKQDWITGIVKVPQNTGERDFFVGTYGAGVLRITNRGEWETFEGMRGTIEINPNAMIATPGAVYAGTLDRGLAVYNMSSGRWGFFTAGLPSRNVTAVEARGGLLYIGTDNGLVKVPETTVVTQ